MTMIHVAPMGDDLADGGPLTPVRTIAAAAARALPGDTVRVHDGVYRERVDPPRGGTSPATAITYEAAPGEHVVITGSEAYSGWVPVGTDLWQLVLPSAGFGDFNPYAELVHGDWFNGLGRHHHRGNVLCDGRWLPEAAGAAELRTGVGLGWSATVDGLAQPSFDPSSEIEGRAAFAPASYDRSGHTTILARFPAGVDPNSGRVEVVVRPTVFTPTREHIDYVTVRGFELRNAATNWVGPSAGQAGLITAYWCRGWVIEDNEICFSRCAGIALGKNADPTDGDRGNTDGYYLTIREALERDGWSRETIGSHVVRNNRIHHCGQVGIVGSLAGAFSRIEGNEIHDCNLQGAWTGEEMAGIKLHAAIDVVIRGNHLYRCGDPAAIWLDWMAQGTQVVGNLLHDNTRDLFTEVSHGPILVANNIMLSAYGYLSNSRGVVVAHNLIAGPVDVRHDDRETPFLEPHRTDPVTLHRVCSVGDAHWFHNILGPLVDLGEYDKAEADQPCSFVGNVVVGRTRYVPGLLELAPGLERIGDSWWLTATAAEGGGAGEVLTTELLPRALVPDQQFTEPDGSPLALDTDYLGATRTSPVLPGPFAAAQAGAIQVWPRPGSR